MHLAEIESHSQRPNDIAKPTKIKHPGVAGPGADVRIYIGKSAPPPTPRVTVITCDHCCNMHASIRVHVSCAE